MNPRTFTRTTLTLATAALMAACGSMPMPNGALDQARSRYDTAKNDTQVASLAPDELKRAGESLRVAEQAWSSGVKPSEVDHLAYLA